MQHCNLFAILVTDGIFTYVSIDDQGYPQAIKQDPPPISAQGFFATAAVVCGLPRPACGERSDHIADVIRVGGLRAFGVR